jgi:hypothetical protein
MAKRKVGSQTGSLTPNHKKLRINLTPMRAGGVRHTIEKLLMRATIFASDLIPIGGLSKELCPCKIAGVRTLIVSSLGILRQKTIRMWVPQRSIENTIWGKVMASPESELW